MSSIDSIDIPSTSKWNELKYHKKFFFWLDSLSLSTVKMTVKKKLKYHMWPIEYNYISPFTQYYNFFFGYLFKCDVSNNNNHEICFSYKEVFQPFKKLFSKAYYF